jgi:hypothetical protein
MYAALKGHVNMAELLLAREEIEVNRQNKVMTVVISDSSLKIISNSMRDYD